MNDDLPLDINPRFDKKTVPEVSRGRGLSNQFFGFNIWEHKGTHLILFYKVYSHRYPGTKNRLRIVQIEGDLPTQIVTIDFHQSAWGEYMCTWAGNFDLTIGSSVEFRVEWYVLVLGLQ